MNTCAKVIRSRSLSGPETAGLTDLLTQSQSESFLHSEVWRNDAHQVFPLVAHAAPGIAAFTEVARHVGITLLAGTRDINSEASIHRLTEQTHNISSDHAWTSWSKAAVDSGDVADGESIEIILCGGRRPEGFFCGVDVFSASATILDIQARHDLFARAIRAIQLEDEITLDVANGILRMQAKPPWRLVHQSYQMVDFGNPLGFYVCGFETLESAMTATNAIDAALDHTTFEIGHVSKMKAPAYRDILLELNTTWSSGWFISIPGRLTSTSVQIVNGLDELPREPPDRIPTCHWFDTKADAAAYGSIVIENRERYFELASNDCDLDQLMAWVAPLDDIEFHPA